jgi:hypothetical protein
MLTCLEGYLSNVHVMHGSKMHLGLGVCAPRQRTIAAPELCSHFWKHTSMKCNEESALDCKKLNQTPHRTSLSDLPLPTINASTECRSKAVCRSLSARLTALVIIDSAAFVRHCQSRQHCLARASALKRSPTILLQPSGLRAHSCIGCCAEVPEIGAHDHHLQPLASTVATHIVLFFVDMDCSASMQRACAIVLCGCARHTHADRQTQAPLTASRTRKSCAAQRSPARLQHIERLRRMLGDLGGGLSAQAQHHATAADAESARSVRAR